MIVLDTTVLIDVLLGRTWRRSYSLATADLITAATAHELGGELATANTRHLPMFPGLASPYR